MTRGEVRDREPLDHLKAAVNVPNSSGGILPAGRGRTIVQTSSRWKDGSDLAGALGHRSFVADQSDADRRHRRKYSGEDRLARADHLSPTIGELRRATTMETGGPPAIMISRLLTAMVAATLMAANWAVVPPPAVLGLSHRAGPELTGPVTISGKQLFALTLWLPDRVAGVDGRISFRRGAAEVIGIAPTGHGDPFRPITTPTGASFGAFDISPERGATGVDLVLEPRRLGRLQVRVTVDTAVDAGGANVDLPVSQFLWTVQVGTDQLALIAPQIKDRQKSPRQPRPVKELQRDGHFDDSDVDLARLAWSQAHEKSGSSGPLCNTSRNIDPNSDGCVDIADVQAVLAAEGEATAIGTPESAGADLTAASIFTVTSAADTSDANPGNGVCADAIGLCTLRAAITESNWSVAEDRIEFNLPGTAPVLIQMNGPTYSINARSGGVTIDGYTQPGSRVNTSTTSSNAIPGVELRGNGFSANEIGMYITSANNTIRGLAFHNIHRSVFIDGVDGHDNRIIGNWFGFKGDGTASTRQWFNIVLNTGAHHNVIGSPAPADRNVSGNASHGLELYGRGVTDNVVQNNLFCMLPSGSVASSCDTGIDHNFGPKNGLIGGTAPGEGNVFGPTLLQGIELSHGWDPALGSANGGSLEWQINGHRVIGNWVGFRGDGSYSAAFRSATSDPGGGDNGQAINVYDGSNDNTVEANYIASNYDGIQFASANALRNTARGNFVGVSPLGEPAPLGRWGIRIRLGTKLQVLDGNTIRNASLGGILVENNSFQIRMTQNVITDTPGWAIDLLGIAGPDPNDPGDADSGANTLLNTPVITIAGPALVSGTGLAAAKVELYRATRATGQYGLPAAFLGQAIVAADGSWSVPASLSVGERVTALQIRNDRDTSELSANFLVGDGSQNAPPTAAFTSNCVGLTCNFTDASTDSDGTVVAWAWNFGDGTSSAAQNPSHTYSAGGTYGVSLQVTDNGGAAGTTSQTITIVAPAGPPMRVADLSGSSAIVNKNIWRATVTITVTDTNGELISNALVSGNWNPGGATNCTTSQAGECTVSVSLNRKNVAQTIFTVTGLTGSRSYDPSKNVETSMTLLRP